MALTKSDLKAIKGTRFNKVDQRFNKIEKLFIADHRNRIERIEKVYN